MKNFKEKLVFLIFALVGAGLIVGGAFFISSNNKFKETAVQTQAEIIDIDRHYDSDGETSYTVYVEFEVDGKKYEGPLGYYSSGMYVGDKTDIYYNPLNPNDFRSTTTGVAGILLIGMGIVFFFIGGGNIISSISKSNINKKLLVNGRRIYAEFDRVELNRNYAVNGRNPYIIICQGTENDYNEFVSANIWKNPERYIEDMGITHFEVYVDYDNPKKYYMPLNELSEILK